MINNPKQIVVGMSGGVDSSMSLVFLKEQGWQVIGVSLKLFPWQNPESFKIAQRICKKEKVPHYILDISGNFRKKVIDYFISEYQKSRTPNPCAVCNPEIKFKTFFDFAKKKGIQYVATGHYAGIREKAGTYQLLRAKDKKKDQSYFLSFLPQKWLKSIVFPMGSRNKDEVYELAHKRGYRFFKKVGQSQDVCFLANRRAVDFLRKKIGIKAGEIVDTKGNVLGKHNGLYFYTIGQRKRIGLSGGPYFVKALNIKTNSLIVTRNKKDLLKKEIFLCPYHFINELPKKKMTVTAKTRSTQSLKKAVIFPPRSGKVKIVFNQPVSAATPGQFCVFYSGQVCLGGGVIN